MVRGVKLSHQVSWSVNNPLHKGVRALSAADKSQHSMTKVQSTKLRRTAARKQHLFSPQKNLVPDVYLLLPATFRQRVAVVLILDRFECAAVQADLAVSVCLDTYSS
jgi:hypothetical protein